MFRKLYFKIQRYFFYKHFGFYPEDVKRLVYVQKYLDNFERKDKSYNETVKECFNAEWKK